MALDFNELIGTTTPDESVVVDNPNQNPEIDFIKLDAFMYRSKKVISSSSNNYREKYYFPHGTNFYTVNDVIVNGTIYHVVEYNVIEQSVTLDFACNITDNDIYFSITKVDLFNEEFKHTEVNIMDIECESATFVNGTSTLVSSNSDLEKIVALKALLINGLFYIDNFTYTIKNNVITISIDGEFTYADKISLFTYIKTEEEDENKEELEVNEDATN